jgi:hypothetical protein
VRGAASSVWPATVEGEVMTVPARKAVQRHARVMLAAVPPRRRGSTARVLRELAFAAIDDEGHGALLRQEELAKRADCGRATVQRALEELEELDLIRRHLGDRSHCAQCARARRGMVVYDVVIPESEPEKNPGQQSLLTGLMSGIAVMPVAGDDQPRDEAGSGLVTRLLNDSTNRSTANNPSLKGSPSNSNAPSHRPLFDFRTPGTDRGGARVGAGRSRGRRGSRSQSSDVASAIQVAAASPCALLGRETSELVSLFELWDPIAERMERAVPESTWHIWLAQVHPHDVHDGLLVIGAPEDAVMWVRSRFGRVIGRCAASAMSRPHVGVEIASCLGAPALDLPRAAA